MHTGITVAAFFTKEQGEPAKKGHAPAHIVSDAVGSWIVSDILQAAPVSEEERRLVRTVGTMITRKFAGWWN